MIPNCVIHGDCVQVLSSLPAGLADFALTDPPYLVRYTDRSGRTVANDDNPTCIVEAFAQLYRVLAPDSFCVSFYGWNSVATFMTAWKRAGFQPVGHIVWHKNYASRRGFLCARHEQAYLLAKGRPARPAQPLDDVRSWQYSGNVTHPTEKAVGILTPLIESFSRPGALVLDPFSGSGSTLVAAALTGRRYLGIELEAGYVTGANRRLAAIERRSTARTA